MSDSLYARQRRETRPMARDEFRRPPRRYPDHERTMVAYCMLLLLVVGGMLIVQIALGP